MRTARAQNPKTSSRLSSAKNTIKFQFDDEPQTDSQSQVTIKDLCPEDKAKIGDLIKRLAHEQEEKQKLIDKIKAQEEEHKRHVKKYQQLTESAKKDQRETEAKFRESLEVIKKLQQQETLIQEQMLLNHVTKFDSFTQCELENKENSQQLNQTPPTHLEKPPKPKSEILQLKAELEEITQSLKQMQFGAADQALDPRSIEISPLRPRPPQPKQQLQPPSQQQPLLPQQSQQKQILPIPRVHEHAKQIKSYHVNPSYPSRPAKADAAEKIPEPTRSKSEIAVQANLEQKSESKCVQTDEHPTALKAPAHSTNPRVTKSQVKRFYDEFIALENKLQQNKEKQIATENMSFQKSEVVDLDEEADELDQDVEDEYYIAQLQRYQQERSRHTQSTPKIKRTSQNSSLSQLGTQNQASQSQLRSSTQFLQSLKQPTEAPSSDVNRKITFPQQTQVQQSNNFKTNTLSFNYTNEQTPLQSHLQSYQNTSNNKKLQSESYQFGSSMMQTPQQHSLFKELRSEEADDIDSIISSLNGRTFNKVNVNQNLQYQFDDQPIKQSHMSSNQQVADNEDAQSSNSSIPHEEYQRIINQYKPQLDQLNDDI